MNFDAAEKISTVSSSELIKLSSSIETSNISHKNNIWWASLASTLNIRGRFREAREKGLWTNGTCDKWNALFPNGNSQWEFSEFFCKWKRPMYRSNIGLNLTPETVVASFAPWRVHPHIDSTWLSSPLTRSCSLPRQYSTVQSWILNSFQSWILEMRMEVN